MLRHLLTNSKGYRHCSYGGSQCYQHPLPQVVEAGEVRICIFTHNISIAIGIEGDHLQFPTIKYECNII